MADYLNPGNVGFHAIRNDTYIDKTGLIEFINQTINTPKRMTCVTRARRFGKSFAAKMLCAYYDCSCDSRALFQDLKIAKKESFERHLNQYHVIYLDITLMMEKAERSGRDVVTAISEAVLEDLHEAYPEYVKEGETFLSEALLHVARGTNRQFVIIFDEWDVLFREEKDNEELQRRYLRLLRALFKGGEITDASIAAAYMTGILPIKKYGSQSAISDFREFTMEGPLVLAEYVGFTEEEVRRLCTEHGMDFVEAKRWYDGYTFGKELSVYNPNSVKNMIDYQEFRSYWMKTESFESVKNYISMNFDGLRDAIVEMLSGNRISVNTDSFQNDITSFGCADDVLTLLVHLGYLSYDQAEKEVYIPNWEVADAFKAAVKNASWKGVSKALEDSERLLRATLRGDAAAVANALELVHESNSSVLAYHNESSLACAIRIAYYTARNYYDIIQEFPSGKGFADIVFLPFKNVNKPALLVELKCNRDADSAIRQIKEKRYAGALKDYAGRVLLVGVNYDKEAKGEGMKAHSCVIEEM